MIDIYQESNKNKKDTSLRVLSDSDFGVYKMISFDLDDSSLTLIKVIGSIKDAMATVPDDNFLGIYMVSGLDRSTHSFLPMVYEYVSQNFSNVKWFYRGKIHLENTGFINRGYPVFILQGSLFIYNSDRLNLILDVLSFDRKIFNNFIEEYLSVYKNSNTLRINISDILKLGLNFNLC